MNTKVEEVCNIVGKMCILQATVCVTVKFELQCVSVMTMVEVCVAAVCTTLLSCF